MWESVGLAVVILFMLIGLIGAFVPLIPGTLLVWLSVLVYSTATHFAVIDTGTFTVMTIIAFISGTSDIWLSFLGAKVGGAGLSSILWGMGGSLLGLIVLNLPGALLGYAGGILYGEYRKHGNWQLAVKASLTGLAGWGISAAVEAAGAIVIIVLFFAKVLA